MEAKIVNTWQTGDQAGIAVAVKELNGDTIEYIATIGATEDLERFGYPGQVWADLDADAQRAALLAAVKAVRDAQQAGAQPIAGMRGTVTL